MSSSDSSPERMKSDVVDEALRISEEGEQGGATLRLLGGVAIRLRARDGLHPAFEREYADLDWIVPKGKSSEAQRFFDSIGYTPHVRFNAIHGRERLLFFDEENDRQIDVLVGIFRMSHQIPFGDRLALEPVTVPLAELLLTKLQIVQLNEKDVRDALALLHDHPVQERDGDAINAAQVARLCAADWGLWRTFTANLAALEDHIEHYELAEESKERIAERVGELQERIEEEPKSFGWRMRAKIGDRKRWYELPEEVEGGP
jgi:DNA-binding transcriptional MerR regulator